MEICLLTYLLTLRFDCGVSIHSSVMRFGGDVSAHLPIKSQDYIYILSLTCKL